MNPILFALLRAIHIVSAAAWVGGVLFVGKILMPSVQSLGPAAGPLMQHLTQVRRMPIYLMGVAIVAVLSGLILYGIDSAASGGRWATSSSGMTFGIGGLLGVVAVIVGAGMNSPAARRLGALMGTIQAAGRPPTAEEREEIARLQSRLTMGSRLTTILLMLATIAMAVARFIP